MIINGQEKKVSIRNNSLTIASEEGDIITEFSMRNCDRAHLGWIAKVGQEPYEWTVTLNFSAKEYRFDFGSDQQANAFHLACVLAMYVKE